jgi:hypothetical protein
MNNPAINVSAEKELRISTKKHLSWADTYAILTVVVKNVHKRRLANQNPDEPAIDTRKIKQDPFRKTVRKKVK